jgi:hypothetical protein
MYSATSNAVISRFGSPFCAALFAGGCVVSAVCADSAYAVFLLGTLHAAVASSAMLLDVRFL